MFNIQRHKNNIRVVLNNGMIKQWNHLEIWEYSVCNLLPSNNLDDYFNNKSDYFKFKYHNIDIKLCGIREGNGDLAGVFLNNDYKFLEPENGIIIDIGANIGDSSIYFALNNAKKVIALEPYPYSYNQALKNININNLNNKIVLLNAGYGEDSEIKIDENKITNGSTALISSNEGKKIKTYSLETLINNYNLDNIGRPNIRQLTIYIIFLPEIPVILSAITMQLYATPMKNLYLTIFYASPVY